MVTLSLARLARVARPLLLITVISSWLFYASTGTAQPTGTGIQMASALGVPVDKRVALEGWVTDAETGKPLDAAVVTLNSDYKAVSSIDGYFSFPYSSLPGSANLAPGKSLLVDLSIEREGREPWTIRSAKFYAGDILRLYPRLRTVGVVSPGQRAILSYSSGNMQPFNGHDETSTAHLNILSVEAASLVPPSMIRVYRTASGVVENVPFREYVKHVLPNEWIPSWSPEALKAGAMAVKSYGWYWVSRGGKQVALGADVKDNVDDQVYDPDVSYASTDAAVDATFQYSITRGGDLFQAQYCAGRYGPDAVGECPWPSQYMTQWGSAYHGDHGRSWGWILQFYYPGAIVTPNPPGGGYTGPPLPRATAVPTVDRPVAPPPPAPQGSFTVGQGSDRADVFQEAYARNGGTASLGRPTGPVRWWLQYVTEFNVVAQPFSGPDGRGNTWIVYDVLKANDDTGYRAFVINGDIAATYANNVPPGPEWLGAPTSDPFLRAVAQPSMPSQGFTQGLLTAQGTGGAEFSAWPNQVPGWKAEFFVGRQFAGGGAPGYKFPGLPAYVNELASPQLNWAVDARRAQTYGAGPKDWSVQLTRNVQTSAGKYDLVLKASSGARLWVDGVLVIDGWAWNAARSETYSTNLTEGLHPVRLQYFSQDSSAAVDLQIAPSGAVPPPVAPVPKAGGSASLRIGVQWLGRGLAPSDNWVQPLTLQLSAPGNPTVLGAYTMSTDRNGVAIYQNLPAGIFDVHVKGAHSIQSARAAVKLSNNVTAAVDMKALIEGDADGDNCVTVADFAILQAMLGANKDTPGFNQLADLNGDGTVSMTDISLLRSGFDRCGDISADNDFQSLNVSAASSLSQQMEAWLRPESQHRNLRIWFDATDGTVRSGEIVEIRVIASTDVQPVDGASFLIRYDPARLVPVDADGHLAKQIESGVALPSVMGNWIDTNGGLIGYSCGMLQGEVPAGDLTLAVLHFRAVGPVGKTDVSFEGVAPTSGTQLTNGGINLLGGAEGATLLIQP